VRVPNDESATARARWLAELAHALEEARHLMKELGADEGRIEAVELYARIEAVRLEVEMMRIRRSSGGGQDFGPEWTKDIPWRLSA
jgi:hypothetical protein